MKRIIGLLLLAAVVFGANAQNQTPGQTQLTQLPVDSQIRYGKLPNGLTYYIRHNQEPRQRAEFYIAQRVGSMQEEDNQRGLAHFLEHMAFNGTKNFPEKTMLNYLETIGAKFGANVNAYTSFDETVYNLSDIPTTRDGILDSCMLVLHDWSSFISLEEKEIDKERGVIMEEWRTRNTGQMRILESLIPQMYPGSRYSNRLPIGDTAIIANFTHQQLRDYYHKWYRPDLQGIVIVGDFDAARMEERLKRTFADIPAPVNPVDRIYYPVQDNAEPIVAMASDKEMQRTSVMLYYKHNVVPTEVRSTLTNLILNYMKSVSTTMLNTRFAEIAQKADPPFIGAGSEDGRYFISATKDAFIVGSACKDTYIETAFQSILEELQRVKIHGFTPSEYERAKAEVLSAMENHYNERNKRPSAAYVSEYVDHFLNGGYIPGVELEYELYQKIAPEIPVEQINQMMQSYIGDKNVVMSVSYPEKEGFTPPSQETLLSSYDMMKDWEVEPYQDVELNIPLIAQQPRSGSIVSEEKDPLFDATVWHLSNGATVIIKKTDFKEDEIAMTALSLGGSSLVADSNLPEIKTFNDIISVGGLGDFSAVDLQKKLAGKRATSSLSLGTYTEAVNASCSPKDLETMMQLIYLSFNAPRKDVDAFKSYTTRLKATLENAEANPMVAYGDSIANTLYGNHPRAKRLKADHVQQINYDAVLRMQRDRFKYASDFVFVFVGNIDEQTLRPLVTEYIASLRGNEESSVGKKKSSLLSKIKGGKDGRETFRDIKMTPLTGEHLNRFTKEMQTPKVSVTTIYSGKLKYTTENAVMMALLKNILDIVYTQKVREDEGGTYGVSVRTGFSAGPPRDRFSLQISFDTNKEQEAKLTGIIHDELKALATNGPTQDDFAKSKEYLAKQHAQNLRQNGFWLSSMCNYYVFNSDNVSDYDRALQSVTVEKLRQFVAGLLRQKNVTEVIMEPK